MSKLARRAENVSISVPMMRVIPQGTLNSQNSGQKPTVGVVVGEGVVVDADCLDCLLYFTVGCYAARACT
jgi:hypothetical protein